MACRGPQPRRSAHPQRTARSPLHCRKHRRVRRKHRLHPPRRRLARRATPACGPAASPPSPRDCAAEDGGRAALEPHPQATHPRSRRPAPCDAFCPYVHHTPFASPGLRVMGPPAQPAYHPGYGANAGEPEDWPPALRRSSGRSPEPSMMGLAGWLRGPLNPFARGSIPLSSTLHAITDVRGACNRSAGKAQPCSHSTYPDLILSPPMARDVSSCPQLQAERTMASAGESPRSKLVRSVSRSP